MKDCQGGAHDSSNSGFPKGNGKGKVKGKSKGKTIDVTAILARVNLRTRHRSLSLPSQTPSAIDVIWCSSGERSDGQDGWVLTVDATCHSLTSGLRPPGAEYMLLDSVAQIHACPIENGRQTH